MQAKEKYPRLHAHVAYCSSIMIMLIFGPVQSVL